MLRKNETPKKPNSGNPIKATEFIAFSPIVYYLNAFYVFGGQIDGYPSNTIGRLDATTLAWTKPGGLIYPRESHGAIFNGKVMIVAGGHGDFKRESCSIQNEEFNTISCAAEATKLYYYSYYPEMYLVDDAFCKNV